MFRFLSIILVFSLLMAVEFRPDVKWYQYETKNFRLIFNENSRYLADQAYEIVEEIFDKISSELGYSTREKVDILFNDTSDLVLDYANFFANTIMINTAKVQSSQIGPFSKPYLYNLITHELTHIIHLQMSPINDGLYSFVKRTTAKGWMYPYFMVEGMAVYNEKQISNGGRLYNSSFSEQFMAFAKEDDFPKLTQVYQRSMVRWPMGHGPYLFGAKFVDYLVETYGLGKLVESYRYFAGQVDATYEQAFFSIYGLKLEDEYFRFINNYKNLYLISMKEEQTISKVLGGNQEARSAVFIAEDVYYAYLNDFKGPASIILVNGNERKTIYESSLLGETKIGINNGDLYFTKIALPDIYRSKILLVKLNNKQEEIIDDGIVDIAINNNGVLYIKNYLGKDSIIRETDGYKTLLYTSEALEAVALSQSGKRYAFIEKIKNEKTLVLQQGEKRKEIVSGDIKDVLFVGEDIWFVASKEGLSQLFRYDEKKDTIYQKTQVLTGVYDPQVIEGSIFFSTYTSRGMDLVSANNTKDTLISRKELLTAFAPTTMYKWVSTKNIQAEVTTKDSYRKVFSSSWLIEKNKEPIKTATDYNIWSLKMMYLYPYFYADNYGSEVGFSTYLSDSLEFNSLLMNFYSSNYGKYFNIQYLNSSVYPNFILNSVKDGSNDHFMTGFQFPIRQDKLQQSLFVGIKDYYEKDQLIHNSYELNYLVGTVEMFPYSISYEKGFINQLSFDLSRQNSRASVMNSLQLYIPGFSSNHVTKLAFLGAYSRDFSYRVSGIPGVSYVRGLDMNDSIKGGILGKVTCEYRLPIDVVDELSLFGLYHKHTGLIFFYDLADAKDSREEFMRNPFWSYGASIEMLGEYSNFYPISLGFGIAKTSQKEAILFFSFGSLLN